MMVDNDVEKKSQHLEVEAKYKIIAMDNDEKADKKKVLEDAKEEVTRLYREFRQWVSNNMNSEEINERFERLKQETTNLMNRTKQTLQDINEHATLQSNKTKAKAIGNQIVDRVNEGFVDVMNNEHVSNVVETISETIDHVRSDERVVEGVKKIKKGTLQVAQQALDGLKKMLESEDDRNKDQKG